MCQYPNQRPAGVKRPRRLGHICKNYRVSGEFSQWITQPELHIFRYSQLDKTLPPPCPPLRTDIQAGLSVMGRRSTDKIALEQTQDFRLDLSGANLTAGQFAKADFRTSDLQDAKLDGANLQASKINRDSGFRYAYCSNAGVWAVDLKGTDLSQTQIDQMFGDGSVTLSGPHYRSADSGPAHFRPVHWPNHALDPQQFRQEYQKWRTDPKTYTPPQPPDNAATPD
jgi:hypothetical protein